MEDFKKFDLNEKTETTASDSSMPQINPIEDQRKEALRHYEEISGKAHHWSSFVHHAILAYNPIQHSEQNKTISGNQPIEVGNNTHFKEQKDVSNGAEEIFHRFVRYEWNDVSPAFKQSCIQAIQEYGQQARNDTVEDCIKVVIRLGGIRYYGNHEAVAVLGEVMAELEKLKKLTP